jgi:hypothetical protein
MRLHGFLPAFALALLTACASGGSGSNMDSGGGSQVIGGGGAVVAVTPTPITPTINTNAAPATKGANPAPDVLASAGGATLAGVPPGTVFALRQSAIVSSLSPGTNVTGSVAPDIATNLGGATVKVVNATTMRLTIPTLKYDAEIAIPAGWFDTPDGRFSLFSGENSQYLRWGMWGTESGSDWVTAHYAMGYETPVAAIPTSGTAAYAGTTKGEIWSLRDDLTFGWGQLAGNASLNVNFSTGGVTGALTNMIVNPNGLTQSNWNDVSIHGAIVSGNVIAGEAVAGSAPATPLAVKSGATGFVNGGFYGPGADELGAVWSVGDGKTLATGALGATRQ